MAATLPYRLFLAGVTVLGLGAASVVSTLPAEAAGWGTVMSVHKSRTQLCKEPVSGGWKVKIRLDNRSSDHGHNAGMSVGPDSVTVRAKAGEVSKVKSLVVNRGEELTVGMGEPTGEGMGGDQELAQVGAC